MSSDLLKADMDYIAGGLHGSSVGYKSLSGRPEAAVEWETMSAVVDETPDPMGSSATLGPSPITVDISKSQLSTVTPQVDKIRYRGHVYVVAKVDSEDAGAFSLYCLP